MRVIGFSLVGVVMAVQLLFLFDRHVRAYQSRDYPRMPLPVASNAKRHHCGGWGYENISWTAKGGWMMLGKGEVKDQDLDHILRSSVEQSEASGFIPGVRVRIPADASAGIFVNLTRRMERAGVQVVRVAVVEQRVRRM